MEDQKTEEKLFSYYHFEFVTLFYVPQSILRFWVRFRCNDSIIALSWFFFFLYHPCHHYNPIRCSANGFLFNFLFLHSHLLFIQTFRCNVLMLQLRFTISGHWISNEFGDETIVVLISEKPCRLDLLVRYTRCILILFIILLLFNYWCILHFHKRKWWRWRLSTARIPRIQFEKKKNNFIFHFVKIINKRVKDVSVLCMHI